MVKKSKLSLILFAFIFSTNIYCEDSPSNKQSSSQSENEDNREVSFEMPPRNFKEAVYKGFSNGFGRAIGSGVSVPVGTLFTGFTNAFCSPFETVGYLARSIFLAINKSALSFKKLAQWNYRLSQSIAIYITGPADASSKTLRKALLADLDDEKTTEKSEDEYIFGVNVVVKQLQNIKVNLEKAINVYKEYPISMRVLRPYNNAHREEIIFMSEELILLIEKFIQVASDVKDLAQLTDKKDQLLNYAKHFTASVKDLAVMVDPAAAFDNQRKGLKLNIDNNARATTSGGGLSAAQA